jgi:hypothetical protein
VQRILGFFGASLLLIGAVGCGKSTDVQTVHGHVSYHGAPLAAAGITFFPSNGRPVTVLATNGEYTAELAPGAYTVTISVGPEIPPGFKEGDLVPPPKIALPPEYSVRAKSTLTATVAADQSEPINFDLK